MRRAGEVESLSYSTEWNHGESVRVAADGVVLREAEAPASGEVVWRAAEAGEGIHTLTHTSGGETLTAVFAVGRAVATVTLGGLAQVYDGTAKPVGVETDPAGLVVAVTYDGGGEAPTGAGRYAVRAVVEDDVWVGAAEGVLEIAKGAQSIAFPEIGDQSVTNTVALDATASSGLAVSYAVEGPGVLDGNSLSFTGEGTVRVTASQAGDGNWSAAEDVERTFDVWTGTDGASAPFFLDTRSGVRIAGEIESLSYSTEWNHGGSVRVAAGGDVLLEAEAPASGEVVWRAAEAGNGFHTLTHTSGGETLTAVFAVGEATATVTFDRQGGAGGADSATATYGRAMPAIEVPSRAGYDFGGYYTEENGGGTPYYTAEGESARAWDMAGEATLYAKWTPRAYTVAFNANGGTGRMAAQAMTYGTAAALRRNAFTRSGFTFMGWSRTRNGAVAYANGAQVANLSAAGGTVTLYARWAKTRYTVAFNANGGRGRMAAQAMAYGRAARLRANAFTRAGYVFRGWSTTRRGAVAYANRAAVRNLRTDGKTTTLYAQWAKARYTVAFNANGGRGRMAAQAMAYGRAARLRANAFTRTGFTFLGWSRTRSGAVVYANRAAVRNLTASGGTVTLYARWRANAREAEAAKKTAAEARPRAVATTSDGTDGSAVADGDVETGWTPKETETAAWVILSFEKEVDVAEVVVDGANLPEEMRVLLSEDAEEWFEGEGGTARYVWVAFPDGAKGVEVSAVWDVEAE